MPKKCFIKDCFKDTSKGARGYCSMHSQRITRYGDPHYITPVEVWKEKCRNAQPKLGKVQPQTYKKLFGRHEHRVIAEQKIGRKLRSDEHVHHIDNNKHNNSPDNLLVLTRSEHLTIHARDVAQGCDSVRSKLTIKQVLQIRKSNKSQSFLAAKYNVSQPTICNVKNRYTYKNIA